MKPFRLISLLGAMVLCVAACTRAPGSGPGPSAAGAADNWINTGGDAGKTHHSLLTDITPANVQQLGLAWSADLGTHRVLEATPVVIDGVLYTSGVAGRTYAFNAATGEALWRFEPVVDMKVNRGVCCDMANRGVAVTRGRVYVAALDGWLYALDARSGNVIWKTDTLTDRSRGYSSTGAPEIAGHVVIIGNAGSESDVRGYVSAYDLDTGALRWRFWIVPRDPKLGAQDHPDLEAALKTWDPDSRWDIGGGGAAWDAIHFDPETGLVLVGTGNGGPYPSSKRSPRGGDQLYLGCIVALDPNTGRLKWHYQETPGDSWDFTSTQPMVLTHLVVDGVERPVILHAPKNGFLYVLDRRDGRLLRAHRLVRTNWASAVDLATGRPVMDAAGDYSQGPRIVFPSPAGAHNWHAASFDPASGLYYVPLIDQGSLFFTTPGAKPRMPRALNVDSSLIFTANLHAVLPGLPPPVQQVVRALPAYAEAERMPFSSELRAVDPLTGATRWSVAMKGWQDRGGVLSTASGLVFQGSIDGHFNAYESATGKLLASIDTGTSMLAAPMTYRVAGVQYVAVMAAWGGGGFPYVPGYAAAYQRGNQGRLLVFKLGGVAVPRPPELGPLEVAPPAPAQRPGVTPALIARGRMLFLGNCVLCHANQHRSITPDLRRMSAATHAVFDRILLDGLYEQAGMPRWDDLLSRDDAHALHAWLIDEQVKTRRAELVRQEAGLPLDAASGQIRSGN